MASAAEMPPLNRFSRSVQDFYVEQVRAAEARGNVARAALKTKADAEAYVADVRRKIAESFGPLPEKTPLNARVTKRLERDAYTIENVIFESRPKFLVTANLYVPIGRKSPLPGVVGSCGHSVNGKANETYQSFAQGLVRQGYVVLIFDPIGQGERRQYGELDDDHRPGVGVGEHLLAGNQQFLVGEFLGTWRAWDGIRALDYLLSRPEVDPKHVGITGNSGGGTMTTWLCGVERRWTMAAASCFVTTFRRNLENELPADTEQCPPRAIALGLDHADFLAAMAPMPVAILSQERDYFDARGAEEAAARLRRLYGMLGASENVLHFIGPNPHGYSQENREAMYGWFNKATGRGDTGKEPALSLEKDEDLQCTPSGAVAAEDSRPIFAFTRDKAEALVKRRKKLSASELQAVVAKSLKLPPREGVPEYRILRPLAGRKYPLQNATCYAVNTEGPIHSVVTRLSRASHLSRPPRTPRRAVLYVAHHSSDDELRDEPLIKELLAQEKEADFWTCDVRGIGESRPDTCGANSFLNPYGSDYFYAIHGLMLDRPYVGQKTHDVLRVLDWLRSHGRSEVHLVGRGWGALPATFAALLAESVVQVTLKNSLTSYHDVATSAHYAWPLSSFVPNALADFDLPDCYAALASKKLRHIEPWNAEAGRS